MVYKETTRKPPRNRILLEHPGPSPPRAERPKGARSDRGLVLAAVRASQGRALEHVFRPLTPTRPVDAFPASPPEMLKWGRGEGTPGIPCLVPFPFSLQGLIVVTLFKPKLDFLFWCF